MLRMGLGSLMCGRAFPELRDQSGSVGVKLEEKYTQ